MTSPLPYNETELFLGISQGDERAYKAMFEIWHPKLLAFIFRLTGSKEQSEDIVNDVFLKIWISREQLKGVDNIRGYLFRMAKNRAYDNFRRAARETLVMSSFASRPREEITDPAELAIYEEIKDFIQDTVNNLTPQQRQVYILSRDKGMKLDDIAATLGISTLTVKKHLTAALNTLRIQLSARYPSLAVALFVLYAMRIN